MSYVATDAVATLRTAARFFASPLSEPRARRGADILLLGCSLVGLAVLVIAYPPSRFERSFERLLDVAPGWLDPVWGFLYGALALWAIVLVIGALVGRRFGLALEAIGAAVLAIGIALVAARLASGYWPDVLDAVGGGSESPVFPAVRVAQAAAVIVTVSPHLVRPLQTLGRWILVLGFLGALLEDSALPSGNLAGLFTALVAAASMRLAFGTSVGRPSLAHVRGALAELGVSTTELEAAERQVAGVFLVRGKDSDGSSLRVKVYGRDAYDSRVVAKLWRTLWYRDGGPTLGLTRSQSVEREGFVSLLAANAGVPSLQVVTAGTTAAGDALLVLRGEARPLASLSDEELTDDVLHGAWEVLVLLGRANIAHLRIDPLTVALVGDAVGFADFSGATVAPSAGQLLTDRAQLLAATAIMVGRERALRAAVDALGPDEVAALLPYLQSAALSADLRAALKRAGLDIDEIRADAAKEVGAEPPQLVQLRRVSPGTLVQVGLLILAVWAVMSYLAGIDWDELSSTLRDASWGWVAFGLVMAQVPRLAQAVGTLGSVPARLAYGPVYALQLATNYMNLALPSYAARLAVNIRFFQRQGLTPAVAVTSGAIDSLANTVVQIALLGVLLLFSTATLSLDFDTPSGDSLSLVWILAGLLAVSVVAVAVVGRLRRAVVGRVRTWWPEVRAALGALRESNKLALLFGGNLVSEVLFATALGIFVRSLGYDIPLSELLVINISVSLLASFIPVPGGIGVVEFGLTAGLVAAGMTDEAAFAAVILYRLSTFYVPPTWGFFAMRWLQRNRYL